MHTPVLNQKSSYKVLHNKMSYYSNLRTFGCLYFANNIEFHRDKFDVRGVKCLVLGYAMGYKAYKVMDLATCKVFVSRDVQFHENIFPYLNYTSSAPSISLPLVIESDNDNIDSFPTEPIVSSPSSLSSPSLTMSLSYLSSSSSSPKTFPPTTCSFSSY